MQENQTEEKSARTDIVTVTPENFSSYVDEKLGIVQDTPEQIAAKELEVIEAQKAEAEAKKKAEEDPTHDLDEKRVGKDKKESLNKRFSEITAARKAAEEAAQKAEEHAKAVAERLEKAEREAAELKQKYEPVKTVDQIGEKPEPSKFTDLKEYSEALEKWVTETTIAKQREELAKAQAKETEEKLIKSWAEKVSAAKSSIEDYETVVNNSQIEFSDELYPRISKVIKESEIGPNLLHYLAKNPEIAESLNKLSVESALVKLGKIESSLEKTLGNVEKETKQEVKTPLAEISKAPAPITPIRNGVSITTNKVDPVSGEFTGTYEEYKQLRRAGKI